MKKVDKIANILNLVLNGILKPKKETRSKMTIYFLNSFIKEISDKFTIISQGKYVMFLYLISKFIVGSRIQKMNSKNKIN